MRDRFLLDREITFLNHGSFGACPRAVLEAQHELRLELERTPVAFLDRELAGRLDAAREGLARLIGADPEGLCFVPNATSGVNTVLRNLPLAAGDALLVTDHAYNACRNALEFVAEAAGASVVVARVPFPLADPEEVVEAILGAVTPATRFALIDHVTSPTGLVWPIARIVAELRARGVETVVDGAHAPGMLPLDLGAVGAAWYAGNCHKWLCAPKGAGFLWFRADAPGTRRPLVISHGATAPLHGRSRFRMESDWVGTVDPTPWLCVATAIAWLEQALPGGLDAVMARNRTLVRAARRRIAEALGIGLPAPEEMIGTLGALPLPAGGPDAVTLQAALYREDRVEVPIFPWAGGRLVRVSGFLYNEPADYERLIEALRPRLC